MVVVVVEQVKRTLFLLLFFSLTLSLIPKAPHRRALHSQKRTFLFRSTIPRNKSAPREFE